MKFGKLLTEKKIQQSEVIPFEHKIVDVRDKSTYDIKHRLKAKLWNSGKWRALGSGAFATAYAREDRHMNDRDTTYGHTIAKVGVSRATNPHDDPGVRYAKESNRLAAENPHLPRTHKITSYMCRDGCVHVHRMERLHDPHDLSHHEIEAMHRHAFGIETDVPGVSNFRMDASHIYDFGKGRPSTGAHGIENTKFADAVMVARRVAKKMNERNPKLGIGKDLNTPGNILARKTPTGPQAVITDPLYSRADLQ